MKDTQKDILQQENEKVERQLSVNLLTPENCRFYKTAGGFAAIEHGGEDIGRVNIFCAFPFTAPRELLSVRYTDKKQEEIGIIESLDAFDTATVELISEQLRLRYFMPKILKLYSIKEEYGHAYWSVLTDKGKCKFACPSGSSGAVTREGDRVIIKDSDENRFEIEDVNRLSPVEMKRLDLYL